MVHASLKETVVLDVDETLVDCVKGHADRTPKLAKELGYDWSGMQVPSYADICRMGGTHRAFAGFEGYERVNELLRNEVEFNTTLEEIEGSKEALLRLAELEMMDFYLTTRPESLARPTLEWLVSLGYPNKELIARPDSIPLAQTSAWKLAVLRERHERRKQPKLMIDDSESLHKAVVAASHPHIRTVVHDGPITSKGNGEMRWPAIAGLLLGAHNWEDLRDKIDARGHK